MGYTVNFKRANLKQIFTLAARDYARDCVRETQDVIEAETPGHLVAQLGGGQPAVWALSGELTESLEKKLKALPFVDNIETDEECVRKRKYNSIGEKIQHVADRIVYGKY